MAAELSTPFDEGAWPLDRLNKIIRDERFSSAAVAQMDNYVSINYQDLKPGDVFLFCFEGAKPTPIDRMITFYQKTVCGTEEAKWLHVGILDNRLAVWDAMPDLNVRSRPLREVLAEKSNISVMRPKIEIDPVALDAAILRFSQGQYRIYSLSTGGLLAFRFSKKSKSYLWKPKYQTIEKRVVCSSFVSNVLRKATSHPFFERLPIVIPADFRQDPEFEPITLHWCRISLGATG